jgi:hypothetical protein
MNMADMLDIVVVSVLVLAAGIAAVLRLAPAGLRYRMLTFLAKQVRHLPFGGALAGRLQSAALKASGGCGGCARLPARDFRRGHPD